MTWAPRRDGCRRSIRPAATPVAASRAAPEAGFPSVSASSLRCGGCRRFIRPAATPVAASRAAPEAGFTLIEILACILLFSVGIMAVIAVITQGLKTATKAQGEATAWATGMAVLKDPLPLGSEVDPGSGLLRRWTWSRSGSTWTASEVSGSPVWRYTTWDTDQPSDVLVPDMGNPQTNNPAVFPPGLAPRAGCANGWINGYYVERREQSRASDRIGQGVRMVEVRVDVYWAGTVGSEARSLASLVDRYIRQEAP